MFSSSCKIFLIAIGCQICHGLPTVKLEQGFVQGTYGRSYDGRLFSAFEGIPYAKPPIGDLRFKEPVAAAGWKDTLIANKSNYLCPQLDDETQTFLGSEDCLYIYVYVPKEHINKNDNLDVVVHIHGGSLISGAPYTMAMPDYIMDSNLIFVTLNYRLGAAGFLSTGDSVVPGNNGLKDQNLALLWVKKNIKEFGGNPGSVTLTGFSSGALSVQYHYLSQCSRGLFHKGFSQSYTVTGSVALTLIPFKKVQRLAQQVQCTLGSSKSMVECLKKVPIQDLVNTDIWFKPVVEKKYSGAFLTEVPYKLLKDKEVYDVPWINSNVINESLMSLDFLHKNRKEIFNICGNWTEWGKSWLDLEEYVDADKLDDTLNKIKKFYLDDCKLTEENGLEKLNKLMTDRHFIGPSDLALRVQAAATKSPVYYYLSRFIPEDRLEFAGPPAASHGVDSKLLFKFRSNPTKLKPEGEKMMRLFVKFLEGFAKTGVPKIGNVEWIPIDPHQKSLNVLEINSPENIKMKTVKELVSRQFWDSLPIKENKNLL